MARAGKTTAVTLIARAWETVNAVAVMRRNGKNGKLASEENDRDEFSVTEVPDSRT